jgi:preprotein translocase subunit SecD
MGIVFLGLSIALPSFLSERTRQKWPAWLPQKAVTLGLDLQGGVHLLLEIDKDALLKEHLALLNRMLRKELIAKKILFKAMTQEKNGFRFRLIKEEQPEMAKDLLKNHPEFRDFSVQIQDHGWVQMTFTQEALTQKIQSAREKSIEIVRRRVDETGAVEPLIQGQGKDRIILQIPGFDDPARVRALLGKTAKLSFHWIQDASHPDASSQLPLQGDPDRLMPVTHEVLFTGEEILEAKARYGGEKNEPIIALTMTHKGGQLFSELTRENIGSYLAIILDKKILMAPRISDHLPNGQCVITGQFSMEEAQNLALLIRSGALPAPLNVLEEKVVGPGLGHDSIVAGTYSTLWAIASVAVLMFLSYSFFGLFAVLGIGLNVCFLLAALVWIGATLTLPGIAGIALTVGMSVDANVLINERIKEELHTGKSVAQAIQLGYQKAMSSVMDSNITTLIGAGLLYMMGTGPVRGFAVTMALGIFISLFVALGLIKSFVFLWVRFRDPALLHI